ncbi:DUF1156 domain-containing protein [Thermosynechococcus sp. HN-54]|uniref:DUF1156 domain-containing protein n=1 Tax=Thermosynechococcus sp. HN-54 TaxID=2933959 RepID=UPI00202CAA84|nr:DUF1156 domain-containing protein [Thermosynechococcus sp. HN-54]URR35774.1 DUF1156 domain-containing protein [Thermosynechococcus sp. HN-54]
MSHPRRLIESRLPLQPISEASAREKSIRHGHISTLHIWWTRKPLTASRAAVFATLVPDTDENYKLVEAIVPWEAVKDGNTPAIEKARQQILEAFGGTPPRVLDLFAGGGAIPLEALRLGCETYAVDLNPVAYLLLKGTLEYPQRYGQPNSRAIPEYIRARDAQNRTQQSLLLSGETGEWQQAYAQNPLATEVRYWGEWVLERARSELADFYPVDGDGKTPLAYLWARTVTCTNPTCRAEVPLVRQWWLAKKEKKRLALKPCVDTATKTITFDVVEVPAGATWPEEGTMQRDNAKCPICGSVAEGKYLRRQGCEGKMGQRLLAVVLSSEGREGKTYRVATQADYNRFLLASQQLQKTQTQVSLNNLSAIPEEPILEWSGVFNAPLYGMKRWGDLFNARQALALVTFAQWVRAAHTEMLQQGMEEEFAKAVTTYLSLILDRVIDKNASIVVWDNTRDNPTHVFSRQALPMVWDYAEINPLINNGWPNAAQWVWFSIQSLSFASILPVTVKRATATSLPFADNFFDAIVTDPPYYDAVPYADLSDFFYVWLRRTVGHLYPEHFRTPLTPKGQEIVQNPVRHSGDNDKAKAFFETMMQQAFQEMHRVLKPRGKATIVFAHKSTDAWETLISALIAAGFQVQASWPLHTEMQTRLRARNSAALASSTFLSCTKREGGQRGLFTSVRNQMQASIRPRLEQFWQAGIRGADFFMSAIGPGLEAYSAYDVVQRADGRAVTVGELLMEVRKIVLEFALEQVLGTTSVADVDSPTQFALLALWAYGNELPSDEARKLAQSTGVELSELGSLVQIKGEKTLLPSAKERSQKDKNFGFGEAVPIIDALHRSLLLLPEEGREGVAKYLDEVGYLQQPSFWVVTQALADILDDRLLHEFLAYRESLPQLIQPDQGQLSL